MRESAGREPNTDYPQQPAWEPSRLVVRPIPGGLPKRQVGYCSQTCFFLVEDVGGGERASTTDQINYRLLLLLAQETNIYFYVTDIP